ncbi:MAG: hypothetical protein JNL82_00085 [Myxococcales bacterium]|nr:hypothetical protein [Myxococcales bacterium]
MTFASRIQPLLRHSRRGALAGLALLGFVAAAPATAEASPYAAPMLRRPNLPRMLFDDREDLKAAYNKALGQYNNLELDPALAGLDSALSGKDAGDPATAPLRMLRAVIIFSNTGKADQTAAAFGDAVKADYNVSLPSELRSPDLQKLLDKARKDSGLSAPSEAFQHTPPSAEDQCGKDIVFTALASKVPDGGQLAFYWRQKGGGEFKTSTMDTFGNLASVTLTASDHGDKPVEYFFYIFDGNNAEQGNKGDSDAPLTLDIQCKKEEAPKPVEKPKEKPKSLLPRVFINIGLGTGLGVARGTADQSYKQYSPFNSGFTYGPAEFACSVARWYAGNTGLPDATGFSNALNGLTDAQIAGYDRNTLMMNYDQGKCGEHHPVKTGMASAPFHIAPEIGIRVSRALVISGFARLQVVTGSKVYRDDPELDLATSYNNNVISPNPQGVRSKPGFTGAGGIKIKYFLGQDDQKFRLFVGGMVGGGFARLRVPMGFANDRNGNSVPDNQEVAQDADALNSCLPVWPYGGPACGDVSQINLAGQVAMAADDAQRIDTVRIGGGFVGAVFGFNYQIVKNFALFAEIDLGVWFPKTSSFLIDLTLGPAITF